MSTTDVHRMIDNKLPEGHTCTAVAMYEVYTATIDGNEVTVSIEQGLTPEDIAIKVVAELATADNAQVEGHDAPEEEVADEPDEEGGEPVPKSKSKAKHKK